MRILNDIVRFCAEIATLVAFGIYGWDLASGVFSVVAALALPLAAAVLWALFIAPKAVSRLPDPYRFLAELAYFGLAALALASADHSSAAVVLAVVAAITIPLDRILPEADYGTGDGHAAHGN